MDPFEEFSEYLNRTSEDFRKIMAHRHALSEILIEFNFDGMMGKDQHRVYEVKRSPAGAYHSSVSGGQEHWTLEPQGMNGEPIVKYREWLVSERGGYIGSFETLEQLAVMIIHQLRGRDVCVVSDSVAVENQ